PAPFARQFHSWGGISPEIKTEIENILSPAPVLAEPAGSIQGRGEARDSNDESAEPTQGKPNALASDSRGGGQSKMLTNDIWVLEGDQISNWVEQEGRLDHDQNFLPGILEHIKPGDTVIDVGAFIGDHTVAYAAKAKKVIAFEPNPLAFECLKYNT